MIRKEANTLVLAISEAPLKFSQSLHVLSSLEIYFPQICFSLIQQNLYYKHEVLFITLVNPNVGIRKFQHHISWIFEINDIQIDAQTHEYIVCPIFVISVGGGMMGIQGELVVSEKWFCLDKIFINIKDLCINVDSNLVESVLKFMASFNSTNSLEISQYLIEDIQTEVNKNAYIYISSLDISHFEVNVSYEYLPSNFQDSLKSYFITFNKLTVPIQQSKYTKLYGSSTSIAYSMIETYKKMIMSNLSHILTQHGTIGGALAIFLKLSGKIEGSKKKIQKNKELKNNGPILTNSKLHTAAMYIKELIMKKDGTNNTNAIGRGEKDRLSKTNVIINPLDSFFSVLKKRKPEPVIEDQKRITRKRFPRLFYGQTGVIKPFDLMDCCAANLLIEKNPAYSKYNFYGQATGTQFDNKKVVFIVFDKIISMVDVQKNEIMWEILPIYLKPLKFTFGSIIINGRNSKDKAVSQEIKLVEPEAVLKIKEIITALKEELNN